MQRHYQKHMLAKRRKAEEPCTDPNNHAYTDDCTPVEGERKKGRVFCTENFDRVNDYTECLWKGTENLKPWKASTMESFSLVVKNTRHFKCCATYLNYA